MSRKGAKGGIECKFEFYAHNCEQFLFQNFLLIYLITTATWAFDVELIEVCSLVNLVLRIFIWSKTSSLTFLLCGFSKYLKNTYIPSSFYKFSNLLGIISNLFFCFKFDNQVILRCYGLCDFAGGFITSSILDCLVRSLFSGMRTNKFFKFRSL